MDVMYDVLPEQKKRNWGSFAIKGTVKGRLTKEMHNWEAQKQNKSWTKMNNGRNENVFGNGLRESDSKEQSRIKKKIERIGQLRKNCSIKKIHNDSNRAISNV